MVAPFLSVCLLLQETKRPDLCSSQLGKGPFSPLTPHPAPAFQGDHISGHSRSA